MSKQRRTLAADFKREATALMLDQGYSHIEVCRSLGVVDPQWRSSPNVSPAPWQAGSRPGPRHGDYRAGPGESPQRVYGPCMTTAWPLTQLNQADTPSQGSVRASMSMRLTFSVTVRSVIMGCVG